MTTYTSISNALVAVGAKPFATTIQALRDNPLSIAEGTTGSPVTAAGWHPYNSTINGTGDGVIYDFAISGAVTTVTSPDFADGFEYMVFVEGVTTATTGGAGLSVNLYRETSAAYAGALTLIAAPTLTTSPYRGWIEFRSPRRVMNSHYYAAQILNTSTANAIAVQAPTGGVVTHATAQKILRAQIGFGANSGGGKLFMYRRTLV